MKIQAGDRVRMADLRRGQVLGGEVLSLTGRKLKERKARVRLDNGTTVIVGIGFLAKEEAK